MIHGLAVGLASAVMPFNLDQPSLLPGQKMARAASDKLFEYLCLELCMSLVDDFHAYVQVYSSLPPPINEVEPRGESLLFELTCVKL